MAPSWSSNGCCTSCFPFGQSSRDTHLDQERYRGGAPLPHNEKERLARLRSLQSYVETAEAELSQHEESSTKARAVLPGAARELATLALAFSEDGNQGEAAGLFAHSLTILEAAFGSAQPELAAFKSEVQRVVDSGAQNQQSGAQASRGGVRPGMSLGQPLNFNA